MMAIQDVQAMGAGIAFTACEVRSVVRKGRVVLCDCDTFPIEKVFVEFEDEDLASSFEGRVKDGTAEIVLDEDTSINAAPDELREEYELASVAGDKERLERVLTELWEEYGIHAEDPPEREASGIKRLAIMHDDGVNAFGFKGDRKKLTKWMRKNGFREFVISNMLEMYD